MLRDNLVFIILIAVVGVAALLINYFINLRENQQESRSSRLRWLKEQAEHTLNALAILKEADCREDITDKLNQHALALIEEIGVLAPDSELMTDVSRMKETSDRARPTQGAFDSDRAVKRAQIYITFAEKLLIDMANRGKMTPQLAINYQQDLYWLNLSLVADAHLAHSAKLEQGGDKIGALSHLKHAKAILVRAKVTQRQKQPKLDQVQAIIDRIQPPKDFGPGKLAAALDDYLKE